MYLHNVEQTIKETLFSISWAVLFLKVYLLYTSNKEHIYKLYWDWGGGHLTRTRKLILGAPHHHHQRLGPGPPTTLNRPCTDIIQINLKHEHTHRKSLSPSLYVCPSLLNLSVYSLFLSLLYLTFSVFVLWMFVYCPSLILNLSRFLQTTQLYLSLCVRFYSPVFKLLPFEGLLRYSHKLVLQWRVPAVHFLC